MLLTTNIHPMYRRASLPVAAIFFAQYVCLLFKACIFFVDVYIFKVNFKKPVYKKNNLNSSGNSLIISFVKSVFFIHRVKEYFKKLSLKVSLIWLKYCFNPSKNSHFYLNPIMRGGCQSRYNFASSIKQTNVL